MNMEDNFDYIEYLKNNPLLKENEDPFARFNMKVDQKGEFPYQGTIKRTKEGWQLYDINNSPEETEPFSNLMSLLSYYNITKDQLSGDYVSRLNESKEQKNKRLDEFLYKIKEANATLDKMLKERGYNV